MGRVYSYNECKDEIKYFFDVKNKHSKLLANIYLEQLLVGNIKVNTVEALINFIGKIEP